MNATHLNGLDMKTKATGIFILVLITLGSVGCSSSPRVYYWRGKAYAKNPETGKMASWKYKVLEERGWKYGAGSNQEDVVQTFGTISGFN